MSRPEKRDEASARGAVAKPDPRPRRRRWLRRLLWLAAIAVVARIGLGLAALPVARAVAARFGLELACEDLELALLQGRVELWRVEARIEREDEEPLPFLTVRTLALDLDTTALLRGHVRLRRLELDGGRVELARDAAGTWNVDPLLARLVSGASPEPAAGPREPYEPRPIVLEPPIEVVAARLQDFSVHLRDELADPPLDATLTVSLTAVDVGSPGLRARFDALATSPELLDLARVRGSAASEAATADLELELELANLRPRPLAHLMASLGLEPVADRIDGGLVLGLRAAPATELGDRVEVELSLREARLSHDGREALALDALTVDVAQAWPRGALVREVRLEGPRVRAERLPDGAPGLCGIAWRGGPAPSGDAGRERAGEAPPSAETSAEDPFEWAVEAVIVRGGRLDFEDRALAPAVELAARLDELELGPLSPDPAAPAARLELRATLPGVVERVVATGTLRPFDGSPGLELLLEASGVVPERIAPYLALAGLEPALASGTFRIASLSVGAGERGGRELAVRGLALEDGGTELAGIDSIVVGLRPDHAPDVEVAGARLRVTREPRDTVTLLGLRLGASPLPPSPARTRARSLPEPAAGSGAATFSVPVLSLPSVRLQLEELLLVDEGSDAPPASLGPLTASLAPVEVVEPGARAWELRLEGDVELAHELDARLRLEQANPDVLSLSGRARARGLDLERLRPWLDLAGLEPALADGSLDAELSLTLAAREGRPVLDLELGPLRLAERAGAEEREWLGLDRLAVEGLVLGGNPSIEVLRLESPRLWVQREADGGLRALGLRRPPPAPPAGPSAGELAGAARAEASGGSDGPRQTPGEDSRDADGIRGVAVAASAPAPAGALRLGAFDLDGARVLFEDLALAAPHSIEIAGDLRVRDLAPGAGAKPTALDGRLLVGPWELTSRGEVVLDPADLRLSLELSGTGLGAAPLAPYLPPGLTVELEDGVASGSVQAQVALASAGGRSASLRLEGFELRERGAERPLAALAELRVVAPRIDPQAGVFEVDEVRVEGARLAVLRTSVGGLGALGLRVGPAPETAEPAAAPADGQTGAPSGGAKAEARVAGGRVPQVRVGRISLELAELRVASEDHPQATPAVASARLSLREPFELALDPQAEDPAPPSIGLDLEADLSPGFESLVLGVDLSPFAESPRLDATVAVRGLAGAGLLALAPELAEQVDPSGLTEGTFDGTLGAELSWRRRGPLDFDLGAGFGAELLVSDVALRSAPGAEVALGVDRIEALVRRIAPASGLVHATHLEVDTPRARLRRTPEGIELAGLVLRLPEDAGTPAAPQERVSPPGVQEAGAGVNELGVAGEVAPEVAAAPPAPGEFRLDDFVVHGVDVRVEDTTVDPPLVLPLKMLEVDVRGFTTRALVEPIPIRISASAGAGDVRLPVRAERASLLGGLASAVARAAGGERQEPRYEQRPVFQEGAVTARLTLAPVPTGWIRASLTGFELLGLRGLARQGGVEIDDGVLDFRARVRLEGEDGGRVESVSSFASLSLSEPDSGPISRFLSLPAPLDAVLFALENEQGEHRIPLSFDFAESGDVHAGQLTAKASAALLGLVTEALASAPVRVVGGVPGAIGLGGLFGGGEPGPGQAGLRVGVPFAAGDVRVGPAERERIADLAGALRKDPLLEVVGAHTFGPEDLERAERLASPGSEEAATLLRSLRLQRDELVRRRDELVVTARVHMVLGEDQAFADTRTALAGIGSDLGSIEDGIDRVAELQRPGAESRRARRTREAALAIARSRLDALTRALIADGVPYDRIDMRPPRLQLPDGPQARDGRGRIELVTRGGTPPKGFFRRILGWIGL